MVEYICGCGNKMMEQKGDFKGMPVKGWKCRKCGEEILDPNDVDKIIKLKSAMKEGMVSTVTKVGNNLTIRIPKLLERFYKLKKGEKLRLRIEKKGIYIDTGA